MFTQKYSCTSAEIHVIVFCTKGKFWMRINLHIKNKIKNNSKKKFKN